MKTVGLSMTSRNKREGKFLGYIGHSYIKNASAAWKRRVDYFRGHYAAKALTIEFKKGHRGAGRVLAIAKKKIHDIRRLRTINGYRNRNAKP